MRKIFELEAELRSELRKGASRRLRHADLVPAILYGADKGAQTIQLKHNELLKALEKPGLRASIITLNLKNTKEPVIIKDIQRHPYKKQIMHIDFLRIKANEKIHMDIPLKFLGTDIAPGVKVDGGNILYLLKEVEIKCLPADLPEYIEVDVSSLRLNGIIHLSELQLPKNVELAADLHIASQNLPIVTIQAARVEEVEVVGAPEAPVTTTIKEAEAAAEATEGEEPAEKTEEKK
jgi:large subunit ribosomal protein L25